MDKKRYPMPMPNLSDIKISLGVKSESIRSQLFRQDMQFDDAMVDKLEFLLSQIINLWDAGLLTMTEFRHSLYRLEKKVIQHTKTYNGKVEYVTVEDVICL